MKANKKTTAASIWRNFRNENKGANFAALLTPVINQLGGVEAYTLQELAQVRSAADGWGGFIYSNETNDFYFKNRKKIIDFAKDFAEELGEKSLVDFVANFGCLNGDTSEEEIALTLYGTKKQGDQYIANALAWFALEEVAFPFQNYLAENNFDIFEIEK